MHARVKRQLNPAIYGMAGVLEIVFNSDIVDRDRCGCNGLA
jgi:hypothetical protein